jgi:CheY-like chemotaxis protein
MDVMSAPSPMLPVADRPRGLERSVLIVEDDPDVGEALKELLQEEGYEVALAVDGRQALERLDSSATPGVILLDLMMPELNGYEFRAHQLQNPRLAAIPTIALTAGAIDQRLREMRLTGWVRKPVPVEALLAVLQKVHRAHPRPHDHLVHFYDTDEKLADKVAAFLAEGLRQGDAAVTVASEAHGVLFRSALARRQIDVSALEREGRLVLLDAAATLQQLFVNGSLRHSRFESVVGNTLDRLAAVAPSQRVRAYGEMVNLLWLAGDIGGALALEARWNELGETKRFSLLCAYLTGSACPDPRDHDEVLHQHSAVL